MPKIIYRPVGIVHSPFKTLGGVPIQPTAAVGIQGTITVYQDYVEGLADLDGFSHIILLYHFHLSKKYSLKVTPYMDKQLRGVFATRAPARPNPIGLSVVHLLKIEEEVISIENVDIVDGTPLLDIKPYVPDFDRQAIPKIGWLKNNITKLENVRGDERFRKKGTRNKNRDPRNQKQVSSIQDQASIIPHPASGIRQQASNNKDR